MSVLKIALIHDDFQQAGGAESLFATIASLYPKAPIYTSLVDWNKLPKSIDKSRIKTSFIQKIPFAKFLYKTLLPLYPLAFESFNFKDFDVVVSSTTRFAKSIITKPQTTHICYINSVPRFLWDEKAKQEYLPMAVLFFTKWVFTWLKRWDKAASQRVDFYIANSQNVADSVEKYYGRKSDVVHPFADLNFYDIPKVHNWQLKSQDYFLIVSRLVKWKKIDIAIEACSQLGASLKIAGTGPDEGRLKSLAAKSENIEFLNRVTKEQLKELYQNAKALIVTQEEDFGIASVEAQACGVPVVAYSKGGQKEILTDNKTGVLFDAQSTNSLKDAITRASGVKWSKEACRANSQQFSQASFVKSLTSKIKKYASQPR